MGAVSFSLDRNLLSLFRSELPLHYFVETGTFRGETLAQVCPLFAESYSVEKSPSYYQLALKQFAGQQNVHLFQGDSPSFLASHRVKFSAEPTLFWLDAHWCVAQDTAGEDSQSPLIDELHAIQTLHSSSTLMIDDARLYLCPPPKPHRLGDWPDMHDIARELFRLSSAHRLMVYNDVILFYPAKMRPALSSFAQDRGVDWLSIVCDARSYHELSSTIGFRFYRRVTGWLPKG